VTAPTDEKTADRISKAIEKFGTTLGKKCDAPELAALDACAATHDGVVDCMTTRAATTAIRMTSLAFGEVQSISDPEIRSCQKTIGKQAVGYVTTVIKAMESCLGLVNDGKLAGDAQVQCLGADGAGLTLPAHKQASSNVAGAGMKLETTIEDSCPGAVAAPLDACSDDAGGIVRCLECSGWREAIEMIRSTFGPS